MKKSYLSQQVKLMTMTTADLMTEREFEIYQRIVGFLNEMDRLDVVAAKNKTRVDEQRKAELLAEKKRAQEELNALIKEHDGRPRTVRVSGVTDTRKLPDGVESVDGVSWSTLRFSRQIAEFMSDFSRYMGLHHNDVTFDKIIVKWKSQDILRQIVLDGFYMPIRHKDGTIENRHFDFVTASAGQLRTDKIVCLSDRAWEQCKEHILGGLTWDIINAHGGLNVSKYFAYTALGWSATEVWDAVDLDHTIVVKDFSNDRTGIMDFIHPDYTVKRGEFTVSIKDTDGVGMVRPDKLRKNQMIRGLWVKGLVTPYDWPRFCKEHNVPQVLTDAWGQVHDLKKEDIQMILTTSQLKLWKFYDSWEHYKACAKKTGWTWLATNYEERYIPDAPMNYQFIESLVDFTDEEMNEFTQRTWDRIRDMASSKEAMLRTMRADEYAIVPYNRALAIYPPLLRDGYTRSTLKAIKKRWTMDAQSGKILCDNKRLYVIPDLYAACEYWFLHDEHPKGLLKDGEVACALMNHADKVDVLRSPHLYMEHAVRTVTHDPNVYKWLNTFGIYVSCHDLISRILQFDSDGDMLNVSDDKTLVSVAERNIEKYNVVPLFYDANEVPPELLSREMLYIGLVRAHNSSGIGIVSNNLCKLWNSDNPDFEAAKLLCYFNNQVIDGAKLPAINSYEQYPEVAKRINAATGGRNGRMPAFFAFSRNGRRDLATTGHKRKVKKANKSVMNRICARFSNIGHINMNLAGIPAFNWEMLMPYPLFEPNTEAIELFCKLDDQNLHNILDGLSETDFHDRQQVSSYDALREMIEDELTKRFGSLSAVYPSIVWYLFTGENEQKIMHKQMFWRLFGDIAIQVLEINLVSCRVCPDCGASTPIWGTDHTCRRNMHGFITCVDCGKVVVRNGGPKQVRCPECQEKFRGIYQKSYGHGRFNKKAQRYGRG